MSDAGELLKSGDLESALAAAKSAVKAKPAEARERTLLFQLLCVAGDWKRAEAQLKVVAELDEAAAPMAQMYARAIECELFREDVFAGKRSPLVLGEPNDWIGLLIEALRVSAEGKHDAARGMRDEAFERAEAVGGTWSIGATAEDATSSPIEWIADADSRMGPCLEVIVNGKYYWAPFDRIAKVNFEPPEDLRDLVWPPGQFTWSNEGTAIALIPTRYENSWQSDNDEIRLGRLTTWEEHADGSWFGMGQRMLATDASEAALPQLRSLELNLPAETPKPASPEA